MSVIQAMDHQVYVVKELSVLMFSVHTIVIVNQVIRMKLIRMKLIKMKLIKMKFMRSK